MKQHQINLKRVRKIQILPGLVMGLFIFCYQGVLQAKEVLSLPKAFEQTLNFNADLQLFPYQVRSAEASKVQANLKPQAKVTLELENAFGNGDNTGLSQSETTLTLGQIIELGAKRKNRLRTADAKVDQLQKQYDLKRVDVLAETGRRYHDVLRLQSIGDSYNRYIQRAQKALKTIKNLARSGSVGQAHVSKINLEVARAKAAQKQISTQSSQAKRKLAMMWQDPVNFEIVEGDLTKIPTLPSQQQIAVKLETIPLIRLQQSQVELAQQRLQLAKANGTNDIDVGLGVRHLAETDDQALVFQFSMPIGQQNPNRGNILSAQTEYEQSQLQQSLMQKTMRLNLTERQQRLFSDHAHAATLQQLLPQAEQLLKQTAKGYLHGQYSIMEWVDAQKTQFELEQESINTHSQIYLSLLELERLSGQSLLTLAGESNE